MSAYMFAIFPFTKGSISPGALCCRASARLVDLLRLLVLPHVVVDDGQVQRRLGVRGVEPQRRLEGALRPGELALVVVDDAEHVVDVGERLVLLDELRQVMLGLRVLLLVEVAPPQGEQLLERLVHVLTLLGRLRSLHDPGGKEEFLATSFEPEAGARPAASTGRAGALPPQAPALAPPSPRPARAARTRPPPGSRAAAARAPARARRPRRRRGGPSRGRAAAGASRSPASSAWRRASSAATTATSRGAAASTGTQSSAPGPRRTGAKGTCSTPSELTRCRAQLALEVQGGARAPARRPLRAPATVMRLKCRRAERRGAPRRARAGSGPRARRALSAVMHLGLGPGRQRQQARGEHEPARAAAQRRG